MDAQKLKGLHAQLLSDQLFDALIAKTRKKKEIAFTMQPQLYLNCKITIPFSSSVTDNEKVIKFLFLLYYNPDILYRRFKKTN